jgi:hypothetical protein
MKKNGSLARLTAMLVIFSAGLVVCGTLACQEDYALGSQVAGKDTARPSVTPTEDGDETVSSTRTSTPTVTATGSETGTPAVTAVPTTAPTAGAGLFQELSALGEKSPDSRMARAAAPTTASVNGNWLGDGLAGAAKSSEGGWIDNDGDGYSDVLEQSHGSDPSDAMSVPVGIGSTRIEQRVRSFDSDLDGISTGEELRRGTDPNSSDSDSDGIADGAEVLSGGNPLGADDRYMDRDGDGLSDEYEAENSLNPQQLDSDGDGLRDDLEVVVGSDGKNPDSDGDGISDGKEFDLGSDPTLPEKQ